MYRTKADGTVDVKGRILRTMKIVFEAGRPLGEDENEMIMLAKSLMDFHQNIHGVLIFGYSSDKQSRHGSFDRGRVVVTRDGRGWLGNGFVLDGNTKDELGALWFQRNPMSPPLRVSLPLDGIQKASEGLWESIKQHLSKKPSATVKPPVDPSLVEDNPREFGPTYVRPPEQRPPWTKLCPVCLGSGGRVSSCQRCEGKGFLTLCSVCMKPIDEHSKPCDPA